VAQTNEAFISEIFSSIQGEGPYCGVRQLFLRFARCNLNCGFCDSPDSREINGSFPVELNPGSGKYIEYGNPISIAGLLRIIGVFSKYPHHSIAITGGEPLLQVSFLKQLFLEIQKKGIMIYLETNGTLPCEMEELIELVDIIAMDIKLPSSAGITGCWKEHKRFLNVGIGKDIFIKIVVNGRTDIEDIEMACQLIHSVSPQIPLIIQPETAKDDGLTIGADRLITFQDLALKSLGKVRIIPQIHKFMGNGLA